MKSRLKKVHKVIIAMLILLGIVIFCIWQNNDIVTTTINYHNEKIPDEFGGYTIVQISDLHNKNFGKNQDKLLNKIKKVDPDIIVVTGDLIDSSHTDVDVAMDFIKGAVEISPVYYVTGNHEAWSGIYHELKQKLVDAGVYVFDNSVVQLEKEGASIDLIGVDDPAFLPMDYVESNSPYQFNDIINSLTDEKQSIQILLSHRPELLEIYAKNNIDLVFTGHAHGGQFRIPFLGGLVAPNQGLFPKYTSGTHKIDNTTMVVSRGLGNSIIPVRIFNRPEIVVVTLKNE